MATSDDFFAIDMRVGTILSAEPFHEARKPSITLEIELRPEVVLLAPDKPVVNGTRIG